MNIVRILAGLLLCGAGIYVSFANWHIFYLGRIKRVRAPSWIPLFGGPLAAVGTFWLLPGHLARWCWIWLFLDWGSVPGLTEAVIYFIRDYRKERRSDRGSQEISGTAVEPDDSSVQRDASPRSFEDLRRTASEMLVDRGRMYTLFSDGKGGLFLEVICGGIFMYPVTVMFSPEEAESFEREGKPFLDSLSYRIARGLDDRVKPPLPGLPGNGTPVQQEIQSAVEQALREDFAEDGLTLYLKSWVVAGHRREVVDELLASLQASTNSDVRANVLEFLYFLHGTVGSFKVPGLPDPRPENAKANQPMTQEQLQALVQAALSERDQSLWDSYCSLFSNLLHTVEFSPDALESLRKIAARTASDPDQGSSRCRMLKRDLDRR